MSAEHGHGGHEKHGGGGGMETGVLKNPTNRIIQVGAVVPKLVMGLLDMVGLGKGGGGGGGHDSHGH